MILAQPVDFEDLELAHPSVAKGLRDVLALDAESLDAAALFFETQFDNFGSIETRPLKPGGGDIQVTRANRHEYVQLMTRWHLVDSVSPCFTAFKAGFLRICGSPALELFAADELEVAVCGLPHLDFGALEKAAVYDGGYSRGGGGLCDPH